MSAVLDETLPAAAKAPARAIAATTVWWWTIRRELWENRSILIAPLVVAILVYLGFVAHAFHQADLQREGVEAFSGGSIVASPAHLIALFVILTTVLVGLFYCADALHGERTDRSILFWKSLPVSDRMVVLTKASIPMLVLPVCGFVLIAVTQALMYVSVALINGAAATGPVGPLVELMGTMLYAVFVVALWYSPVYAWLLFVSSWARRVILTALLPLLAAALVERIAFGTSWFGHVLRVRLFGLVPDGLFVGVGRGDVTPNFAGFLSSQGLWAGLAVAIVLVVATVWMRRRALPL